MTHSTSTGVRVLPWRIAAMLIAAILLAWPFVAEGAAATYTFAGLDGHAPGEAFQFSVTALVTDVSGIDPATTPLRYRGTLTRNGTPIAGQSSTYPDAGDDPNDPQTWSTVTTDVNGQVWFGPATGFTVDALNLDVAPGVTTPFRTSFDLEGDYELTVQLFDITDGPTDDSNPVGAAGSHSFTVAAPEPVFIPAPEPTPDVIEDDGVATEVEDLVETEVGGDEPVELEVEGSDGSTLTVGVPAGALPEGSKVTVGAVADLDGLVEQAPPPEDADLVLGFVVQATDAEGNPIEDDFAEPVALQFTVPADAVPEGAGAGEIVLAFWDGAEWVEVEATVTANPDRSFEITASVDHFTIFGVAHEPGRGTFAPAPMPAGLTLATWQGGGYQALDAYLGAGASVWVSQGGSLVGYIVGAPAFTNAAFAGLFPDGLTKGTAVIVSTP